MSLNIHRVAHRFGYQRVLEDIDLRVAPGEAVAVEDAPNGIRSALAAGMAVVAVPPHFHPPGAELLSETTVVESLDQLTLDVVAEALSRAAS